MLSRFMQFSGFRPHQLELMRRTVAASCTDAEFDLFIEATQHYGLDPFRRQIMPLVLGAYEPGRRRMVVVVSIDGQRILAQRCGNYRAASEPPKVHCEKSRKGPTNPLGILYARVRLWQQDQRGDWFPVVGGAYWDEFAPISAASPTDASAGHPVMGQAAKLNESWGACPV